MIQRDHHGLRRWFYHARSDQHAPTLRQLFANSHVPCQLDVAGAQAHLGLRPLDATATCFAGVRAVRPGYTLFRRDGRWTQERMPLPGVNGNLLDLLALALENALTPGTALALGGGLDSALLLAVIRRVLRRTVPVLALCPRVPGYSEREAIVGSARALDVEPNLLEVAACDFVAALPDCVRFAEVPLYNLHPVSKLLFARMLKERGIQRVITGDGADQVFAGVPGWDYLPIVGALFAGAGVHLCCPFLDVRVAAWAQKRTDPSKSALRELGRRLLPASIVDAAKVPQLAPEMDLSSVEEPRYLELAGRALGRNGSQSSTADVRVVTLALLFRHFPRLVE
jgi:asparagine synthetase B (glutamine-hydrolysing)